MNPTDRALLDLLSIERGGVQALRTTDGDNGVYDRLYRDELVKPNRSGRYVLTAAGRKRAEAAQSQARAGSIGSRPLRGVK